MGICICLVALVIRKLDLSCKLYIEGYLSCDKTSRAKAAARLSVRILFVYHQSKLQDKRLY